MQWAINFTNRDKYGLITRISGGQTGNPANEINQRNEIKRLAAKWRSIDPAPYIPSLACVVQLHKCGLIPWRYLYVQGRGLQAFKSDRYGLKAAIERAITSLEDSGN